MSRWSLVLAGLLGLASMQARAADPLSVMSFNIRLPAESDGVDYWETRKPLAVRMLREQQPDVIGLQELVKAQADYLARELPQYAWFGRGREADGGGESEGGKAGEHGVSPVGMCCRDPSRGGLASPAAPCAPFAGRPFCCRCRLDGAGRAVCRWHVLRQTPLIGRRTA